MYWDYYPRAAPRPKPKPGMAKKKFGTTWWGKKWVEILSRFEGDQRMSRGRAYARAEMVKRFQIENGKITADVQGSSGKYKVKIDFERFCDKDWNIILDKLNTVPIVLSKLLNNEMPEDIEQITGYSFVPDSFNSKCSCPDYANPCKHIAAVFYTLADEIDYDPMSLFALRGMEKESIFAKLGMADDSDADEAFAQPSDIAADGVGQKSEKKNMVKRTRVPKKASKEGKKGTDVKKATKKASKEGKKGTGVKNISKKAGQRAKPAIEGVEDEGFV